MRLKLAVYLGLILFALLSAADWVLTFALLRAHPGAVESNPIAAATLERYGWGGLALYKTASVLAFVGAVVLLMRRRPAVAAGVVALGCATLLAVTTYSHGLLRQNYRERRQLAETEWPPRADEGHHFNGIPIPERCVFAPDRAVTTASRD